MRRNVLFLAFTLCLALVLMLSLAILPAGAQNTTQQILLTNNTGTTSTTWFIAGEASLVINGFDLTPRNLGPPIVVDAVNIAVETAIPGVPIDVVVYQDPNGGSPVDAQIVGRASTTINSPGLISVPFQTPILVNAPVLWVGFYLPVDFRFFADESGTSVLTYWGWTPNSTFDVTNLATAAAFGPGDGTDPIGLNMNGIARITANIRQPTADEVTQLTTAQQTLQVQNVISQLVSNTATIASNTQSQTVVGTGDTSALQLYNGCEDVSFDPDDINISGRGAFSLNCRTVSEPLSIATFRNANQFTRGNNSWQRKVDIYQITGQGGYLISTDAVDQLRIPVTHCIRPLPEDLNTAVVGIAYGFEGSQEWEILPSARFGDLVCAEVTHVGYLAYFVPFSGSGGFVNANLVFTFTPILDPDPPRCGRASALTVSIKNDGFEAAGPSRLLVRSVLSRAPNIETRSQFYDVPAIAAGGEFRFTTNDFYVYIYDGEAHIITYTIDFEDRVFESNENDNEATAQFILDEVSPWCATPTPRFPGDPNVREP